MAKFVTQYSEKKPFYPSESGDPIRKTYKVAYDKDGNKYLEETGQYDQDEYIQSFAAETDINTILARYITSEDPAVLNRRNVQYSDVPLPDNIFEATEQANDLYRWYMSQPEAVREKLSLSDMLTLSGTSEGIQRIFDVYNAAEVSETAEHKEEVKDNA